MILNIIGSSTSGDTYSLLKKSMDASALRSKVSANNIANINTKNYKGLYVTFEETLKDNMTADTMKTDNSKDIQAGNSNGQITVNRDESTSARQDGNNVDIDLEMTNQAANTLMYAALVSQVNSKISLTSYVIGGGK
ncbi:flagellar basal body rod protein FlgB [Clostridium estertheticum]|uniref:Flagellar basal body rod protein FlgB n=2 Tax=Clostridium estertheticum TaxID=238834 RepID=A0A5N7J381_9CLOT|nr:flagellar basal body rod protein FlgB [Clostridium estertheticum]MBU3170191.1 flagellar basal body rod protein FlgB [Clostridium estertheticum]MBZ9617031.1 flagellar basal body rod protein FlgB [Clostridium estertheticum subsp. laramiense]MPQ32538.1 flagellar basal body rod protein FlgB [Clostridium estertheticum]MPQ63197.1 flagellar basal body rod protein FlgB [Clostridium estertheticum]WAG76063.1 flagellar basal body rod protein FlgB [Clostridium estertheticum]